MWFNAMFIDQSSHCVTGFIATYDTCQSNGGPEARRNHRDSRCATETVFFFLDTNYNAWLFGIQLRGISDQIGIEDQVANDRDVRALARIKHEA